MLSPGRYDAYDYIVYDIMLCFVMLTIKLKGTLNLVFLIYSKISTSIRYLLVLSNLVNSIV